MRVRIDTLRIGLRRARSERLVEQSALIAISARLRGQRDFRGTVIFERDNTDEERYVARRRKTAKSRRKDV